MEVYITNAKRTAIGSFMGSLSSVEAVELGSIVIRNLIENTKINPNNIDEIILGNVLTAGLGQNPARNSAIKANVPYITPSFTVGKVCGSGLKSIILGIQAIICGDADIIIAGGQENMSLAMHAFYQRSGTKIGNGTFVDTMLYDGLTDVFSGIHMGITAENIASRFNISREIQDEFAFNSQIKANKAQSAGRFDNEIVPVTITNKKETIQFKDDEFIKGDTTLASLSKLRPAFQQNGTVTAGNASGINDGAAAVVLMSANALKKYHNIDPIARVVSYASSGVDPNIMGIGPITASRLALNKAGWRIDELNIVEANEAFAAQAYYVIKEMGFDPSIVNVNGGAIALGHPIGASGARILVTLLHEMKKRTEAKRGLATLCIGGGMGISLCIEKV